MRKRGETVHTPDGRSLEVVEGGDESGWPIVVHHWTPLSAELYDAHAQYAATKGIRLISYSRPGYGSSDPSPGRKVADAASDIATIAGALGLGRFGVWGHSGGASHALACAALLPDRAAAAAASDGVAPFAAEGLDWLAGMGSANVDEYRSARSGREDLEAYLRHFQLSAETAPGGLSPEMMTLLSPGDSEILAGELGAYLATASEHGLAGGLSGWVDDDLETVSPWGFRLDLIRVPTRIWHGKLDRFVPFSHAVWLSRHIPGSELTLLDDETHLTVFHRRGFEILDWLAERSRR